MFLFRFLPWLYGYGHSFNDDTGLVGRYDAAEMLRISISLAWAMILVLAAMSVVTIAGASKLLWSGNSGWWRLRIHGFMLMLLWLGIPSNLPGLLFSLTILASGLVELIGWKSFRSPMPVGYGLKDILDIEEEHTGYCTLTALVVVQLHLFDLLTAWAGFIIQGSLSVS